VTNSYEPGADGRGDRPHRPPLQPWAVERANGGAGILHARGMPRVPRRTVVFAEVDRPAFVLGSTQPDSDVDATAAERLGVEVVRRTSGGGGVLVAPVAQVWADVFLPRDDPLWDDDVGRAVWWLGEAWASALFSLGVPDADVHQGAMVQTLLSSRVCFAGLGPGEVTVAGAKAVGISQRRTRDGALFQCAVPLAWDTLTYAELLSLDPMSVDGLAYVVDAPSDSVESAFLLALSQT
jgi:lipoate-protein ligase A